MALFSNRKLVFQKCFITAFFLYTTLVQATVFNVTNTNDNGPGSLREAVTSANFDLSATVGSPHLIDMTSISGTIVLDSAMMDIRNFVNITGPADNSVTISRSNSAASFSILRIKPINIATIAVNLTNLVISNGSSLTGGGIYVENAELNMDRCRVTRNFVNNGLGGGICTNNATVNITNSCIDHNLNLAGLGGGIYMNFGSLSMTNCTVYGNHASIGGGLDKATVGTVIINNCTFAFDTADDYAGGIYINFGNIEANNTIITGNIGINGANAVFGNLTSTLGHNLVDNAFGMVFTGNTSGNIVGFPTNQVIPNSLSNNGGPTPTVLLYPCSWAKDAGSATGGPTTDQRGFNRAAYAPLDIGALEYSGPVVSSPVVTCGNGPVTLSATGGFGYRWYNLPTGGTLLQDGPGTFVVNVVSDTVFYVSDFWLGCESERIPIIVDVLPAPIVPVVSPSGPVAFCEGGSATLSSSVNPDYVSYNWAPGGQSGSSIQVSDSGSYQVTITDVNGCTSVSNTVQVDVNLNPVPVITALSSVVICQGSSVMLVSNYTSGNSWSTGETNDTITVSSDLTITLTVTDLNGCTGTSAPVSVSVLPTVPPAPVISPAGPINLCQGDSLVLTSSYSSGNIWDPGNETTSTIMVTGPGTYSVTFTDANGCSSTSQPVIISELPAPAAPVITASGSLVFCDGDSVVLSSSYLTGNIWSPGNETGNSLTVNNSGTYHVSFTDVNGCSSASLPVVVTVNTLPAVPVITPFGATTFCDGNSVLLASSSPTGNVWNPGGNTTPTIQAGSTGNYTVTVTDANGCSNTSLPLAITVLPLPQSPTIVASGPTTFCLGDSVVLSSTPGSNIQWNTGSTDSIITVTTGDDYYAVITDQNGCSDTSSIITVTVNTPVLSQISGPNELCSGSTIQLSANNAVSYLWIPGGQSTQQINVSSGGTYSVETTDANGCTSISAPFVVDELFVTLPSVTPQGTIEICSNTNVTLTSSISQNIVWSPGGQTTPSITVNSDGTYFVTVTDTNGCTGISNQVVVNTIPAPAEPVISPAGPVVQCGGSVILDAGVANGVTYLWNDNLTTTQTFTAVSSGIYSVTAQAPNGCTSTSNPVIVQIDSLPFVNLGPDIVQCGGSVTLNAQNPGAVYLWSNGASTQSITVNQSGIFTVDVTNSCGSFTSAPIQITINPVPSAPVISPAGPVHFCDGGSTILTSSYANGNFWLPGGETTSSITVTEGGNYLVVFTDANGCSATSSNVQVIEDPALTPIVLGNDITQCGGTVLLDAGFPGSNYVWSNGAITQTLSVSQSGDYSVTVSNACGSVTSDTIHIDIFPTAIVPVITPNGPISFCQGGTVVLNSSSPGGNVWSDGQTSPSIIVGTTGTYTVTVTDQNGCTATSLPVTVTMDLPPVATNLGGPFVQCGGAVVLNANNAGGTTTYLWSNGATTQTLVVSQSGQYSVIITNTCGTVQSTVADVTINPVPPQPVITSNGPTTFCNGGSVLLTSSSSSGNIWSNGATGNSVLVDSSGIYFVTVTNANNCSATSLPVNVTVESLPVATNLGGPFIQCGGSVVLDAGNPGSAYLWSNGATTQFINISQNGTYFATVTNSCGSVQTSSALVDINTVPVPPVITANGLTNFCQGGQVVLSSSYVDGNLWSNGDTTSSIIAASSGNYSVVYTAPNGCTAASNVISVQVDTPPVATNLGGPYVQCGGTLLLDAANPGSTYLWNTGDTTQTITVTSSGNYSVIITNTCGSIGSSIADVTILTQPAAPVITATGPLTFCIGDSVMLISDTPSGIQWNGGQTNDTITVFAAGSYSVTYTDANGCTAISNVLTVNVDSPLSAPVFNVNASQCGGVYNLDAGFIAGVSYLWSNGQTTSSITVNQTGSYSVTLTNTCGSVTSDTAVIEILTPPGTPVISANGPLNFCQGNSVQLSAPAAAGYLWSNGELTQDITVVQSGIYDVTITAANGCTAQSAPVTVTVDNPLTAINLGGPFTQCGGSILLDAGNPGSSYLWNNGETSQIISVTLSGNYSVTVTNACGTTSSTTAQVTIIPAANTPVVTVSGPITFCQGDSVTITSSETTNITWSNGQITPSITVNQSGTYTVTVDNGGGCTATSLPVIVNVIPVITNVTLGPDITACGGPVVLDAGYPGSTYAWTDLTGNNVLPATQTVSISQDGLVFVVVSNQCSTVNSDTIQVTIHPLPVTPVINASGPLTFCQGDSVVLSVSGITGGTGQNLLVNPDFENGTTGWFTQYQYSFNLFTDGTCFVTSDASQNQPSFIGTPFSGSNFLAVNSSTIGSIFFYQQAVPVTPGNTYDLTFKLASLTANVPAVIQVYINGIAVGATLTAPATTGVWNSYTVSWNSGLSVIADINLVSVQTFNFSNDFGVDSMSFNCTSCVAGANNYTWSTGATGTSIVANTTGNYTVTLTDANGCSATSQPVAVNVLTPPQVNLGGPYVQCGGSVTLDAQNPGSDYLWSTGDTTQTITISNPGTTTVTVTVSNICGTAVSAPADVTINTISQTATITASGPTTFCTGDSVVLTAGPAGSYVWTPNGEVTPSVTITQSGTYSVTVTEANGCSSTSPPVTVTVLPGQGTPMQITASGPTTFCLGGSVTLTSNLPSGNVWLPSGSTQPSIIVFASGTYILTNTNSSGCSADPDTIVVTTLFPPAAIVTINGNPNLCEGDTAILSANSGNSYIWSTGDTTQSISVTGSGNYSVTVTAANGCTALSQALSVVQAPTPAQPVISSNGTTTACLSGTIQLSSSSQGNNLWSTGETSSVITVGAGSYWVTVTGNFGCKAISDTIEITQANNMSIKLESPVFENGGFNVKCHDGQDGRINLEVIDGTAPFTFLWSNGATTQNLENLKGGDEVYRVDVTDANGCTAKGEITLTHPPDPLEKLPQGFSPDNNGVNDQFVIPGLEAFTSSSLVIFNRWGNEVYNSNGIYKNDWSGNGKNGEELPVGTYFIVITADSPECGKIQENRWIELRRK